MIDMTILMKHFNIKTILTNKIHNQILFWNLNTYCNYVYQNDYHPIIYFQKSKSTLRSNYGLSQNKMHMYFDEFAKDAAQNSCWTTWQQHITIWI